VSRERDTPAALVVMAQLREGREQALLDELAALPSGEESPFRRVASTHFCRWLLIPALLGADGEAAEPGRAYLLLTADFDGPLADWVAAMTREMGPHLDRIFEHCDGYRGSGELGALTDFIAERRVSVGFSILSSRATVARVRSSLELRRALREFAIDSQGMTPDALRRAWSERFGA